MKAPAHGAKTLHTIGLIASALSMRAVIAAGALPASSPTDSILILADGSPAAQSTTTPPYVVATLQQALDLRRQLDSKGAGQGPHRLILQNGRHSLVAPVVLTAGDSGTPEKPLVIAGESRTGTLLTGAVLLARTSAALPEALEKRVPASVLPTLVRITVPDSVAASWQDQAPMGHGIPVGPQGMPTQVFAGGTMLEKARWPVRGYGHITVAGAPPSQVVRFADFPRAFAAGDTPVSANGYWGWDWSNQWIAGQLAQDGTLTVTGQRPPYPFKDGQRAFVAGAPEFLGQPGQWYFDRESRLLLLVPPSGGASMAIEASVAPQLVKASGASHVRLTSLTLEDSRNDLVDADSVQDFSIQDCTFRNAGLSALVLKNATESGIDRSEVAYTGGLAVYLSGGSRDSLVAANDYATNSYIHHFGLVLKTYQPGISIDGVGTIIEHNEIAFAPHAGILFWGNDHLIIGNLVHDVALESDDVGAIYTGRDLTAQGTRLSGNVLYNLQGTGKIGAIGIYLDDQASGIAIAGNVIARADRGILIGGGFANTVTGNLLVDDREGIALDDRGTNWEKQETLAPGGPYRQALTRFHLDAPPWSDRYPVLASLNEGNLGIPRQNTVSNNLAVGGPTLMARVSAANLALQEIHDNPSIPQSPSAWASGRIPADPVRPASFELSSAVLSQAPGFEPPKVGDAGPLPAH